MHSRRVNRLFDSSSEICRYNVPWLSSVARFLRKPPRRTVPLFHCRRAAPRRPDSYNPRGTQMHRRVTAQSKLSRRPEFAAVARRDLVNTSRKSGIIRSRACTNRNAAAVVGLKTSTSSERRIIFHAPLHTRIYNRRELGDRLCKNKKLLIQSSFICFLYFICT